MGFVQALPESQTEIVCENHHKYININIIWLKQLTLLRGVQYMFNYQWVPFKKRKTATSKWENEEI